MAAAKISLPSVRGTLSLRSTTVTTGRTRLLSANSPSLSSVSSAKIQAASASPLSTRARASSSLPQERYRRTLSPSRSLSEISAAVSSPSGRYRATVAIPADPWESRPTPAAKRGAIHIMSKKLLRFSRRFCNSQNLIHIPFTIAILSLSFFP